MGSRIITKFQNFICVLKFSPYNAIFIAIYLQFIYAIYLCNLFMPLDLLFPLINKFNHFSKTKYSYTKKLSPSLTFSYVGLVSMCVSIPHQHLAIVEIGEDYRTRSIYQRRHYLVKNGVLLFLNIREVQTSCRLFW